jgi:hypothetical protein
MCFGHSGSIFSLDSLINKNARREQVGYWELFLLRFQICVVLFFAGLAKLNADWLIHAAPLYLNLVKHFSVLSYPLQEKWMAVVLSWGGMLSDLGLGILLFIIQVSVNGKPFQYMFDPTCNLSKVSYSPFKDLRWVLPLKKT